MHRSANTTSANNSPTAVIADDHAIVREGLKQLLERLQISLAAEASNGYEALASVKSLAPTLVILDVLMPLAQGTEVILEIRRWSPSTKIVVYTGVTRSSTIATLVDTGIDGLFLKGGGVDELREQLPLILDGSRYVASAAMELLGEPSPLSGLTARERQVMHMLLAGKSNPEVAAMLSISAKTVDKHRSNLMAKLEVHSFAELMQYAVKHELLGAALHEL